MAHRATVQALLLLALAAAGVAAQRTCTKSEIILNYVAPLESTDPVAKCLTGMRVEIAAANCAVTVTSLNGAGSWVDGIWAGDDTKVHDVFKECPIGAGTPVVPVGTGLKVDAIKNAFIKAVRSYVYGLDSTGQYNKDLPINDVDWFRGRVLIRRTGMPNLVYAITKETVVDADLTNDDGSPVSMISDCNQLANGDPDYDAQYLCMVNAVAADPCPPNSYGVMVKPKLNAWDDQETAFKVCGLCPSGTAGNGNGCTTCQAGFYSTIGGQCLDCPPGTYSNAGSSDCFPCPEGTYSDGFATKECKECPEDSYSWIPGSAYCLRCISGVPEVCAGGSCPSGEPDPGEKKSSPGTHILTLNSMPTCGLDSTAGSYEIKAYTKCTSWKSGTNPRMQLALIVSGDCSIQVSPITDPSCADPTSQTGYAYGAIQMSAYYKSPEEIRTLMLPGTSKSLMLAIDQSGSNVALKFFGATTDAKEGENTNFIKDPTGPTTVKTCSTTATVAGGQVVGLPGSPDVECPAGTFYHRDEYCPICPVGHSCPGGGVGRGLRIPCEPDFYNPLLGLGGACAVCPASQPWTSYEGASSCAVERLDTECKLANTGGTGMQFDLASQACMPCPPGTARDDASNTCEDCPAGTYSGEGAAECEPCPEGQYNSSPGLGDQSSITGLKCVACAEGSMPLKTSTQAGVIALVETGSTFCDACPAGTFKLEDPVGGPATPCQLCPEFTYRTGDAIPENNVCKPVPAGYFLADGTHTTISLCPRGTVSFWYDDNGNNVRAPGKNAADELRCIACSELDEEVGNTVTGDLQFAHTYSPRRGMTKCIPCPGGTIPRNNDNNGMIVTDACQACPNGFYRDAYTVSSSCVDCPAGYEVGSSSKMDCVQCRPGFFMTDTRAGLPTVDSNTCEQCPVHTYRPNYGARSCLPCPRGTQTQDTGNVECTDCPIGYYNNQAGQSCKPAPPGNFVNTTGAFVYSTCPQGTWNDEEGSDNCNPCAPGKYSNTMGAQECKTCPAGTYSGGQAISCLDCNPGYSAPAGAASCSPCKPGTYAPNAKTASCQQCPKGFQCPTNAMRVQAPCPRGTFSNREGLRVCTPCPINTFSNGGGTTVSPLAVMACTRCPAGTNTRGLTGQSTCQTIRPQVRRML